MVKAKIMAYRTVIVDDEQNSVNALQKLLEIYCPELEVIQTFNDPRLALEYILKETPDIIFLDIQMPFITGIEMVKCIPVENCQVIFTTAFDQYAIDAIKLSALDYLLKPIDIDDLKKSVAKLKSNNSQENEIQKLEHFLDAYNKPQKKKLVVQLQNKTLFLDITDIVYLEADSNYTTIFMKNGQSHLTSKTVKFFQEKLTNHNFFRLHQSYLINANYIGEYDKSESNIILTNGKSIPVSKNKKDGLLDILAKL